MPELWDQLTQQPVAEPPSLWPGGDRAPLRITVGGPTMKDGAQASPGSSLDPFNPPQVQYVGTPLANTLWSALQEVGRKGRGLLSGLQQYSGEQFPDSSAGTQAISTDIEPVKTSIENLDPLLANLWGVGSASVPRGAVGAIGSSPFYSAAQRAVENAKLGKGTPEQWLGYLRNQPGVKAEELDRVFGNLPSEGMLTKPQMQAHAAENAVTLGETSFGQNAKTMDAIAKDLGYGGWHSSLTEAQKAEVNAAYDAQGMRAGTRYSQYQLPGGENYREKLLTLPGKKVEPSPAEVEVFAKNRYETYHMKENDPPFERIAPDVQRLYREQAAESLIHANSPAQFQSSHWDEPNVLAHMRMNDRETPGVGKSLHLEEIQSDWHQKGRQQGYQKAPTDQEVLDYTKNYVNSFHNDPKAWDSMPPDAQAMRLEGGREQLMQRGIPDAPFKTTWPDVALKRSIRDAAEGGYDALSWTPGEAQAARYDLSTHVKALHLTHNKNGEGQLIVTPKNGGRDQYHTITSKENLADTVGKEAAEKLYEQGYKNNGVAELSGLDLKIGGEGMKAFYDKMLVDKANALAKKHGARVEQAEIDTKPERGPVPEGSYDFSRKAPVHVLRITPQLREAAMKGFPLFSALFGATAAAPSLWLQQGRQ